MNKTLSFVKLDYLTIKPFLTLKNMLIFLFVFIIIGYGTDDPSTIIVMSMMYSTIYSTYPFAVGDKNGIDTLYATLPLTKKNIVTGRYSFALSLNLFVGAIAFVISAILITVFGKEFNVTKTLLIILTCFAMFTTLQAIQLPIYFKLGYARAKLLAYLPLVAFPAAVIAISKSKFMDKDSFLPFVGNVFLWVQGNILFAIILAVAIWLIIMLFSKSLSYRFYKKREF